MFYEQVKALCDARNIKITGLARSLHLSPSAPNNWKEGSLPKAETIMKIAEYFDVTTDYLLYGNDQPHNKVENVDHSAVSQQNSGNLNINLEGSDLQGLEADLIRVFRSLDLKGKAAVLTTASDEEARMNQQKEK